ncbi:MAG TPA: hypothetical protein VEI49_02500 [Terriglobales bacterium]|nr:hypothetical protein [Terriglobales bacterium]HXY12987.1 hypothetical protein [Terriglobales bacterium]
MNNDEEKLQSLLKGALPAINTELSRDLWPHMLRRLDESASSVPWFDWALATLLVAGVAISPHSILLLLYHL